MSHRRCGALLAGFALATCVLVGCQSTTSFGSILARHGLAGREDAGTAAMVVTPGTEIEWHVKTAQQSPNLNQAGRSIVGPDGKIELGPYGTCAIGGMSLPQATAVLEKHLAKFLHAPSVQLTGKADRTTSGEISWKKAKSGPPTSAIAANTPKNASGVAPAGFQQPMPLGDKDKKQPEAIPPPQLMVPPGMAMPNVLAGPPIAPIATPVRQPSECQPVLLPPYVLGPTDVLLIESLEALQTQPVRGPHLVGPDGAVNVGTYGRAIVAGLTLEEAKVAIAEVIKPRLRKDAKLEDIIKGLSVDVLAYNSKQYYIIADGGGQGEQVVPLPITGNDTVLNAISKINGLPMIASKHHIWVSRLACPGCPEMRLPVDWVGITQHGEGATNWQIMPGDRIYLKADPWYTSDRYLAKILAPFERITGGVLLGSQTFNSLKSGSVGGTR